ncbi:MAG: hypothetical protein H6680_06550 [Desulfobacteraceae bacterium]|nr:hypothetical protein [Desulfobacteraceae bacterium]
MKKINLDLSKHCIKTEIKKQYEKKLSLCLKNKADEETEDMVEILREILETKDLAALRGKYRELSGKSDKKAELFIEEDEIYVLIDGSKKISV